MNQTLKKQLTLCLCGGIALFGFCEPSHAHDFTTSHVIIESVQNKATQLPRNTGQEVWNNAMQRYLTAVDSAGQNIHSIMIVKDGDVMAEAFLNGGAPDEPHILNSVSKTFTATAVGFAVADGLLSIDDKVISFFPDQLPETISPNLAAMTVKDLLTMSCGHDTEPISFVRNRDESLNWVSTFLAHPVEHEPGTFFLYNSPGTYMLSAIIQQKTGKKLVDYLNEKLFIPLDIDYPRWDESPQGINTGGWGLYLKTEDLAKMGQFLLQQGNWNGQQLLPASWIKEATASQIESLPAGVRRENLTMQAADSDWLQGYGYQMWRCRHNAVRADGARGQFIILLPENDTVIVLTAEQDDMQAEINLVWDYFLNPES